MTTRAAIYCRVSSDRQAKAETIEAQRRSLGDYARRQGWEVVGTYEDDGFSAAEGKLDARAGFARLLRDAEAERFSVLLIRDVDRLTRSSSIEERAQILGPFQRLRIQIATPAGGVLDLRTQLGQMSATMLELGAAAWLEQHRERVRQGRALAASRGRLPAGSPPFGLVYDRSTKTLALHPERAPLVIEMCERVVAGTSCNEIARQLHARGVQRPRGRWAGSAVASIIRSRHLIGEWVANRGAVIHVPAIVDRQLWDAAQAAITRSKLKSTLRIKRDYLLVGIGTCLRCGSPIWIRSPERKTPAAYECRNRLRPLSEVERCTAPMVRCDVADARVWSAIERELADPTLEAAIAGEVAGRHAERHDWETDRTSYERKLARLATAESRLLALFTEGRVGELALTTETGRIARERQLLQDSVAAADRAAKTAGESAAHLRDANAILAQLRAVRATAPLAVRRRLIEQLVPSGGVVFDGLDIRLELRVPRPCSVDASAPRSSHGTHLKIRTVA